jgi:pimeloyl-ACP methyl ester carboxylesterase
VVVGRDDPIPLASSEDVARLLEAELDVIPRCGHVPYVERPLELWEALDPFLASTDAVAGSAE